MLEASNRPRRKSNTALLVGLAALAAAGGTALAIYGIRRHRRALPATPPALAQPLPDELPGFNEAQFWYNRGYDGEPLGTVAAATDQYWKQGVDDRQAGRQRRQLPTPAADPREASPQYQLQRRLAPYEAEIVAGSNSWPPLHTVPPFARRETHGNLGGTIRDWLFIEGRGWYVRWLQPNGSELWLWRRTDPATGQPVDLQYRGV